MDCIDLFKKAAAALQTDPRYLELDAARRENDSDEELQNLIGEFNLARLDLNNESAKAETNAARVAELNQRVNDLYSQIMASEGMVSGSIQVPPNGLPVVFLADHPVTGGYPVIATVIDKDLDKAGQLAPGDTVRFELIDFQ